MSDLCIGEQVETIILARKSGLYGEYLERSFYTFGAVRVRNTIFKVQRNIEAHASWYWRVENVNTGKLAQTNDPHSLVFAIREVAGVIES